MLKKLFLLFFFFNLYNLFSSEAACVTEEQLEKVKIIIENHNAPEFGLTIFRRNPMGGLMESRLAGTNPGDLIHNDYNAQYGFALVRPNLLFIEARISCTMFDGFRHYTIVKIYNEVKLTELIKQYFSHSDLKESLGDSYVNVKLYAVLINEDLKLLTEEEYKKFKAKPTSECCLVQ